MEEGERGSSMNVLDAVRGRRSIRNFRKEEIPDNVRHQLIEALLWAPSAGNLQSRKFYLVHDEGVKKALAEAALCQTFIREAPLVVVGCADSRIAQRYDRRGVELYRIQDVSCSIMCMMLVAHELGLGSVWVGAFYEEDVSRILELPAHLRPVAIVPVGWPEKIPSAPSRVTPEEAVVRV